MTGFRRREHDQVQTGGSPTTISVLARLINFGTDTRTLGVGDLL
jgi:hypothetical protein